MATKRRRSLVLAVCAAALATASAWRAGPAEAVEPGAGDVPAAKVPEAVAKLIEAASKPLADSPLVALGRRLFQDPTVSRSGEHACASCHDAEHGWSDTRKVPVDFDGPMRRHSQPIADLAGEGFHWDGEFVTPGDLVAARIGDATQVRMASRKQSGRKRGGSYGGGEGGGVQAGGGSRSPVVDATLPLPVVDRLTADGRYTSGFTAAFGSAHVTSEKVLEAVTAFVGAVKTAPNAVDRSLAGDTGALTAPAQRGLELFRGKAACATCHKLDPGKDGRAALTDGTFHNTGVAFVAGADAGSAAASPDVGISFGSRVRLVPAPQGPDLGRFDLVGDTSKTGAFKTPSLRDVARRAPYMHDGSLATLEDVVRYYAKGCTPNEHLDKAIKPLDLSDGDVADVVAFLESLSGGRRAGLLPARERPAILRLTLVLPSGERASGVDFEVVPFGERLGTGEAPAAFAGKASGVGVADVEFPQTTHVLLRSDTHDIAFGRPIPDTAGELEVLAIPRDQVFVTLRGRNLPAKVVGTEVSARLRATVAATQDGGVEILREAFLPGDEVPEPENFVFERQRTTPSGDAVYAAPVGTARGRTFLRFDIGDAFVAAVDLGGGWSEPVALRPVREASARR